MGLGSRVGEAQRARSATGGDVSGPARHLAARHGLGSECFPVSVVSALLLAGVVAEIKQRGADEGGWVRWHSMEAHSVMGEEPPIRVMGPTTIDEWVLGGLAVTTEWCRGRPAPASEGMLDFANVFPSPVMQMWLAYTEGALAS
ncbi:hypothetical protein BESB_018720 [Besnoitia besnoiti]|uniref:Uncharacterized protein n=1 Tax=Besnoitia besnoiti TaxID=94643 RepID=A0A2A9M5T4_BESBE|nr:hypothetical protein BESB_018720 [Besnoitia besnoiti]PFH32554.1 hypothetical protein BESB_018720 [Besnoitia besnoiti]